MGPLLSFYITATVFGLGITVVDMLGILGEHSHDSGSHEGDGGLDHDDGGLGHDDDGGHIGDESSSDHDSGDHSHDDSHDHSSVAGHDNVGFSILLKILFFLRSLVYFSLGFGPVGIFAVLTGLSLISSLIWSVPVGVVTMIVAIAVKRLQRYQLDSQIKDEDLIMAKAQVIVSIQKGKLGKVRVFLEGTFTDRFARAKETDKSYAVGTSVYVTDVTSECIYVSENVYTN